MLQKDKILSIEKKNDASVVSLHEKRIYMQFTDQFRQEMNALLKTEQGHIIINFSGVNMINSLAIGILISTANELKTRKRQLIIVGLNKQIEELFSRMRLDKIFMIRENITKGLAAL